MINNLLTLLQILSLPRWKEFVRSLFLGKVDLPTPLVSKFDLATDEDVLKLIRGSTIKACKLDPLPATIMGSCYSALVPVFKTAINLSLSTGSMPKDLKIASLRHLTRWTMLCYFRVWRTLSALQELFLHWFHSYLSGRSRFVEINFTESSVRDLTVGIPQGSVLGPFENI